VDFTPTRNPYSTAGIFLSETQVTASLLGSNPHSKTIVNPTPLLGFLLLGRQKFVGTANETTPTRKQRCRLTKSLSGWPTKPVIAISTLKRRNHINSKKPTVKQARQDLNKHFNFKEICVFYSEKSFHSEYIPSNTYFITSNRNNTEFNYILVFTFF